MQMERLLNQHLSSNFIWFGRSNSLTILKITIIDFGLASLRDSHDYLEIQ
jgi:hypothetical protein